MKRHLRKDRYRLDDWEKNEVWRAVNGAAHAPRHTRAFAPAAGLAVAAVLCLVAAAWWTEQRQPAVPGQLAQAPAAERHQGVTLESAPQVVAEQAAEPIAERVPEPVAKPAAEPVKVAVGGRVRDKETGQALEHASIAIDGSGRGVLTDAEGRFRVAGLAPGRTLDLEVRYLGFAPVKLQLTAPDTGLVSVDIDLEPVIVATLQAFEVAGAEYMVDVPSAVQEHAISAETFEKYAIDSVEDALSKSVGGVFRAGEPYVRGGRSGETSMRIDGVAPDNPLPAGSVTGGSTPPNGQAHELMYFEHAGVNPFVATEEDALSTFAVDVDNGSWTLCRSYLERGALPPADAVRVEEFVNAFDPGYARQAGQTLVIHADGSASRFGQGYRLLRVGLAGRHIDEADRKPATLVFVVDVSGSMNRENRLGAVRWALTMLLDQLREGDRVGLVIYGSRGEVRLEPTGIEQREKIKDAIAGLVPAGSTNVYEGLKLAYEMARSHYEADRINRLILCSDGVANNGASTVAEEILQLVRRSTDEGISLSTVGFGMGNYNDVMMEKLADKGDGNYAYVDRREEAERVFRENLTGTLQTIARQTKVQVEFDPEKIDRWRLLGYENRDVADRDFRNDDVDAGEVGAGHRVTALYELKLKDRAKGRLGTVRLRWEAPAHDTAHAGEVTEIELPLDASMLENGFSETDPHLKVQAVAAEFAEILRGSYWAKESTLADLAVAADAAAVGFAADSQAADLARLIRRAAELEAGQERRRGGADKE